MISDGQCAARFCFSAPAMSGDLTALAQEKQHSILGVFVRAPFHSDLGLPYLFGQHPRGKIIIESQSLYPGYGNGPREGVTEP